MNKDLLLQQLSTHQMMLLYFKGSQCSACLALLPKVEKLIEQYPEIEMRIIDVNKDAEISSHFGVYSGSRYDSIHRGERIYQRSGNF